VLGGGSLGACGGGMAARCERCDAGAARLETGAGAGADATAGVLGAAPRAAASREVAPGTTTGGSAVSASATGGGAGSVTKGSAVSVLAIVSGGAGAA